MNISILVPYRNRKENLLLLLTQVKRNLFFFKDKVEVVVVDLGSVDDIRPQLAKFPFVSYQYVEYKGTFSRGWAINIASKRALYEWFLIMDADCFFFEKFLVNLSEMILPQERARYYLFDGVVGLNHPITKLIYNRENVTNPIKDKILEYFPKLDLMKGAGNMLIHRDLFVKVSGYDEKIVGWGREDSDLHKRLTLGRAKEEVLPVRPDCCLYHLFHIQDDLTYNNWWIYHANDFVAKYNEKNQVIQGNFSQEWGEATRSPDQYRYESLLDFAVEDSKCGLPILRIGTVCINNAEDPRILHKEFDGPKLKAINPKEPLVILGGGLNYAFKILAEKMTQILVIEKYKTVKELACSWNQLDPARFVSTDYRRMVDLFVRLKHMNPKSVLVHKPSYEIDPEWYGEVLNFFQS